MSVNKRRLLSTVTRTAGAVSVQSLCALAVVGLTANVFLATPSYAAFTETSLGDTQVGSSAAAQCQEQVDDLVMGLQTAEIAADFIGLGIEAAGAVFIISEIPGIVAQAAALALGTAAFAIEEEVSDKPNCEGDFLGSVKTQAGFQAALESEFLSDLDVQGTLNANGGLNTTTATVSNGLIVTGGGADITGDSFFRNALTVQGLFTASAGMDVTGLATFHDNVKMEKDLDVDGKGTFGEIAVDKGLSVFGGQMWLGDVGGQTFQPGISIGGGAFAGAGTGGAQSSATHLAAIAIGNSSLATQSGSIAFGLSAKSIAQNAVAIGTSAGQLGGGTNSTAVGSLANAAGLNASAVGTGSSAGGNNAAAFGNGSSAGGLDSVAFGSTASAGGAQAIAVGAGSNASASSAVAVGNGSVANQSGAVAMGQGAQATGTDAIAIGHGAVATGSIGVGFMVTATNGGAAFGDNAVATGSNAASLGTGATATHFESVAIGAGSITTNDRTVSFGAPGNGRRLMNVSDGILNSDAPNMGQLRRAVEKLNRGVASTVAMSTPIMDLEPGETSIAMGGGFYEGENGVALRGAYRAYTDLPLMVSGAVATAGNDSWTGQVGFAVKF